MEQFITKVENELGFRMMNPKKVERAIKGLDTNHGKVGGVGEDASAQVILAAYDLLGGYITKDGYKVKMFTFVDRKTKKPIEKPKIVLLIKVNGEVVEQEEGTPETPEVTIAKKQIKKRESKKDE